MAQFQWLRCSIRWLSDFNAEQSTFGTLPTPVLYLRTLPPLPGANKRQIVNYGTGPASVRQTRHFEL